MPTAASSSTSKSKKTSSNRSAAAKKAAATRARDAINLLKADHREVEKLFSQFEKQEDTGRKRDIALQICMELRVHTQIEEEILYPQSREFLKDDDIVNEAIVEHQSAKDLIEQIEGMDPSDEMFEAKVTVLKELIEHHVEEEEKEYFPQVQKSDMDTKAVGEELIARKAELMRGMDGGRRPLH